MIYVLHVRTGKEIDVAWDLAKAGYLTLVPREERVERHGGSWQCRERVLMPGYVFVEYPDLDPRTYHIIRSIRDVYRFLGASHPQCLSAYEEEYIRMLDNEGQPLQPSIVNNNGGTIAGPLTHPGIRLVKISRHRRRAQAVINVMGQPHEITLSVTII